MEAAFSGFYQLGGWWWMIIAAILLAVEIMIPGFFIVWFAVAAVIVGAITFAVDISWQWQLLIFGLLSLGVLAVAAVMWGRERRSGDHRFLNERVRQLIGEEYILHQPIEGGRGRLLIGDSGWSIKGPDLPRGVKVRIVGAEGTILIVEPAGDQTPDNFPQAGTFHR